jgi:hypothetical protein
VHASRIESERREKAIEGCKRTPADQRQAPIKLLLQNLEHWNKRRINHDSIRLRGNINQRSIEIEEQRPFLRSQCPPPDLLS